MVKHDVTKEELKEELKKYEGILNVSMIEYLNLLIELEFSVVKDYIKDEDREKLAELDIYKKIAIYNICTGTSNIFKNEDTTTIKDNGLRVYSNFSTNTGKIKLFDFKYLEEPIYLSIPSEYKTKRIGSIDIYKSIPCKTQKGEEINRILEKLERLYDEKNPYPAVSGNYGGPHTTWSFEHQEKIKRYERRFQELDSKRELTESDRKEIEITKKYHDMLLEYYGLNNKSFTSEEEKTLKKSKDNEFETELEKKFIKKLPNLIINNNIKYL